MKQWKLRGVVERKRCNPWKDKKARKVFNKEKNGGEETVINEMGIIVRGIHLKGGNILCTKIKDFVMKLPQMSLK